MYCFIDIVHDDEGCYGPSLPEDVSFLLLAEPCRDSSWALYDCGLDYDEPLPDSVTLVSDQLRNLLDAGKDYPPAIALCRDKLESEELNECNKEEFTAMLINCLEHHLSQQRNAPYFLAKSVTEEVGYRSSGDYYWIIGFNSETHKVSWVSRDYHIYTDPIECFDLSEDELVRRFNK